MTTTEIHDIVINPTEKPVDEISVLSEWLKLLETPLKPEQVLLAMKHAREMNAWLPRRLTEQHGRYAVGLEPSVGLSRAIAKKLAELERFSP